MDRYILGSPLSPCFRYLWHRQEEINRIYGKKGTLELPFLLKKVFEFDIFVDTEF